MSVTTFQSAATLIDRFITLLHKQGVSPAIGSRTEGEFLSVMQLMELGRTKSPADLPPRILAEAGGMYDLVAKLLSIETQSEFKEFAPHLGLFASPERYTSVIQSTAGHCNDDAGRKLVELYFGALIVHFATCVELDHPVSSAGNNPDVLFTVTEDSGAVTRWAVAIKTISSTVGQTIFDNIRKAAAQIDAKACPADRGLVLISIKSALDHQSLWDTIFPSLDDAVVALRSAMEFLAAQADKDRPASEWEGLFVGRVSPLVLFSAHAVVRIGSTGTAVPTILKMLRIHNPLMRDDPAAHTIAHHMNHFMQVILQGTPGSYGQLPQ